MNIVQAVPTRFAQACEQKLLSSLGKGISKHSERARNIAAGKAHACPAICCIPMTRSTAMLTA